MKTKYAKEKSEYANLLVDAINLKLFEGKRYDAIIRLQELEKIVEQDGDKIIFIVTTRNTNPLKDKCASPMSEEDIKND